jgi:hypothetical protein
MFTCQSAYDELGKLFEAESDGASDVFASKQTIILEVWQTRAQPSHTRGHPSHSLRSHAHGLTSRQVVAKEKNANAFAAGLPALEAFMTKADGAAEIGPQIAEQVQGPVHTRTKGIIPALKKNCTRPLLLRLAKP